MTETERMKQGYIFNELPPEAMEEREALLHDIFGKAGKNVWFNAPLTATVGK